MKALIFISTMSRGGAARVTSTLCHEMVKAGYDVHIATNIETSSIFYKLPLEINMHNFYVKKQGIGLWHSIKMNIGYFRSARRIIKEVQPDIIIGVEPRIFMYTKIGCIGLNIPIIASDHTTFNLKQDRLTDFIRYKFYGTADALTILTQKDYNLLGNKFKNKTIIYNPISFPVLTSATNRKQNILCAGRLDAWEIKGFDMMLDCWQSLANMYPDWILEIAGDGKAETVSFIQKLIKERDLNDRVILLGQVENMQEKLSQTSIFALSSRAEGFPMVLMEAMSQGCACVAFEVGGATSEMITNNEDGIIIKDLDTKSFTNALSLLMKSSELRDKLSANALKSIQRFSPESFMESWNNLICCVINKKHR